MLFSRIFDRNIALLNRQVLVLNRLWQAVNVTTVRRAFTLLCQGHAQIVSTDGANNYTTHDFESWRDFSTRSSRSRCQISVNSRK